MYIYIWIYTPDCVYMYYAGQKREQFLLKHIIHNWVKYLPIF